MIPLTGAHLARTWRLPGAYLGGALAGPARRSGRTASIALPSSVDEDHVPGLRGQVHDRGRQGPGQDRQDSLQEVRRHHRGQRQRRRLRGRAGGRCRSLRLRQPGRRRPVDGERRRRRPAHDERRRDRRGLPGRRRDRRDVLLERRHGRLAAPARDRAALRAGHRHARHALARAGGSARRRPPRRGRRRRVRHQGARVAARRGPRRLACAAASARCQRFRRGRAPGPARPRPTCSAAPRRPAAKKT